eukprot:gene25468-biopygen7496
MPFGGNDSRLGPDVRHLMQFEARAGRARVASSLPPARSRPTVAPPPRRTTRWRRGTARAPSRPRAGTHGPEPRHRPAAAAACAGMHEPEPRRSSSLARRQGASPVSATWWNDGCARHCMLRLPRGRAGLAEAQPTDRAVELFPGHACR